MESSNPAATSSLSPNVTEFVPRQPEVVTAPVIGLDPLPENGDVTFGDFPPDSKEDDGKLEEETSSEAGYPTVDSGAGDVDSQHHHIPQEALVTSTAHFLYSCYPFTDESNYSNAMVPAMPLQLYPGYTLMYPITQDDGTTTALVVPQAPPQGTPILQTAPPPPGTGATVPGQPVYLTGATGGIHYIPQAPARPPETSTPAPSPQASYLPYPFPTYVQGPFLHHATPGQAPQPFLPGSQFAAGSGPSSLPIVTSFEAGSGNNSNRRKNDNWRGENRRRNNQFIGPAASNFSLMGFPTPPPTPQQGAPPLSDGIHHTHDFMGRELSNLAVSGAGSTTGVYSNSNLDTSSHHPTYVHSSLAPSVLTGMPVHQTNWGAFNMMNSSILLSRGANGGGAFSGNWRRKNRDRRQDRNDDSKSGNSHHREGGDGLLSSALDSFPVRNIGKPIDLSSGSANVPGFGFAPFGNTARNPRDVASFPVPLVPLVQQLQTMHLDTHETERDGGIRRGFASSQRTMRGHYVGGNTNGKDQRRDRAGRVGGNAQRTRENNERSTPASQESVPSVPISQASAVTPMSSVTATATMLPDFAHLEQTEWPELGGKNNGSADNEKEAETSEVSVMHTVPETDWKVGNQAISVEKVEIPDTDTGQATVWHKPNGGKSFASTLREALEKTDRPFSNSNAIDDTIAVSPPPTQANVPPPVSPPSTSETEREHGGERFSSRGGGKFRRGTVPERARGASYGGRSRGGRWGETSTENAEENHFETRGGVSGFRGRGRRPFGRRSYENDGENDTFHEARDNVTVVRGGFRGKARPPFQGPVNDRTLSPRPPAAPPETKNDTKRTSPVPPKSPNSDHSGEDPDDSKGNDDGRNFLVDNDPLLSPSASERLALSGSGSGSNSWAKIVKTGKTPKGNGPVYLNGCVAPKSELLLKEELPPSRKRMARCCSRRTKELRKRCPLKKAAIDRGKVDSLASEVVEELKNRATNSEIMTAPPGPGDFPALKSTRYDALARGVWTRRASVQRHRGDVSDNVEDEGVWTTDDEAWSAKSHPGRISQRAMGASNSGLSYSSIVKQRLNSPTAPNSGKIASQIKEMNGIVREKVNHELRKKPRNKPLKSLAVLDPSCTNTTVSAPVKSKPKIKESITFTLLDLVRERKKQKVEKTRGAKVRKNTAVINPLDASAPERRRGKERLAPKPKRVSVMKRIIIQDRVERQLRRIVVKEIVDRINDDQEKEDKTETDPPPMNQDGATHINEAMKCLIHTRKFREYCDQLVTPEIDSTVRELLSNLIRFQDRLYVKDPIKAQMRRRLVLGLREVTKHLMRRKVKCVILAPNIEKIEKEGGLNDAMAKVFSLAQQNSVPVVFALDRLALGRTCRKQSPVSCIGVLNYDGAEAHYKRMLALSKDARSLYNSMIHEFRLMVINDDLLLEKRERIGRQLVEDILTNINQKNNNNNNTPEPTDTLSELL